ncbi:hypothetical protein GIB67_021214 [Kingdonia uniflora]|uniref:CAAX prenyl protease 2/Lysostaphin resistance protein A-like domain-containing protein n=1 Tax=Kingdonia uniflora TaxID=39325 RepID=A0A7J7LFR1_9MAGN|nr:hypothetical protein GIB67_021214 [Kingdonia uniflora]
MILTMYFAKPLFSISAISLSGFSSSRLSNLSCLKKDDGVGGEDDIFQGFSVLSSDTPWDKDSMWSSMSLYFFSLHVPLSFGGLSVISKILHQPVLDPQIEALSILISQITELFGALALLRYSAKAQYKLSSLFQNRNFSKERNWIQSSVLGFGFLMLVVILTSLLADRLTGPKDVNNILLKEILSSGSISSTACFLVYCFVTPLLEEIVYRGFLMGTLSSTMKWQQAVFISSCIFSLAHLSTENSLQLFVIGWVLGCSYCWSGNLSSSFLLHSLYNAVTLIITLIA